MGHGIDTTRDYQYGIDMAWHQLTKLADVLTKELCFPWGVELEDVYRCSAGGEFVTHGAWKVPVASDDRLPLGNGTPVNLDTYTVRTPHDTWDFNHQVLKGTDYQVVSAGAIQNRSRYFICSKLVELEKLKIADGSEIELYLNAIGSMDKSLNESINLSGTRTVCANTMMMNFMMKENIWKYRHSKNMGKLMEDDIPVIERVAGYSAVVKATFDGLVAKPCNKDTAAAVYAGFISRPLGKDTEWPEELSTRAANMVEEHVSCFQRGKGNSGATEFDLLNGWTELRTQGYSESRKSAWDTYESSEFGSYGNSKALFAEMLTTKREKMFEQVLSKGVELLKTV